MAAITAADVLAAFQRQAEREARELLEVRRGLIEGLVAPMLAQGLVDLEGVDSAQLEELFRGDR